MAQATRIFGKDFSGLRTAILVDPVNYVPPVTDGLHLYMAIKYDETAGLIVNPWDLSSDFSQLAPYGKPTEVAGSANMGTKPVIQYAYLPATRIVMSGELGITVNKFSLHAAFTINSTSASNNRRAIFSILNSDATQTFSWRVSGAPKTETPTTPGPAQITVINGNLSPLASKPTGATQVDYDITGHTPAAGTKVVMSLVYDSTVGGGTVYVYKNGGLICTIPNVGAISLNGTAFLGAEVMSSTVASDFKGELGYFAIDETARTAQDIATIHTFLTTLFSA